MPASRARRLCPHAVVIPPDFTAYRETSQRGVGARATSGWTACSRWGSTRPTPTSPACRSRCACCASWSPRSRSRPAIQISVGVGPSRLVAKCCSDLGKPAGLRRDGPRGGVRALRAPRRRSRVPGHRPEDRRAAGRARATHRRPAPAGRRGACSPSASATAPARFLQARARTSRTTRRSRPSAAPAKSRSHRADVRHRHRRPRRARGRCCGGWRASSARAWSSAGARGPHDRDQGPPRRLDDGHPRPHARGADATTPRRSPTSRSSCCAPTRRRGRCGCSACASRASRTSSPRPPRAPPPPGGQPLVLPV